MNNKHILDLTLRLSQSLDQNYDVVSMDTVLSVIAALEGTTITKEQLEATRLAKYINQLRRRTKCENLARRAKCLLKKWREMVGIQQSNDSSATAIAGVTVPLVNATSSSAAENVAYNMPVTDNAVSTSHLINSQISHQHFQRQIQYQQSNVKHQKTPQQQPYHSQPSSPVNLQEKSNPNEFLISMSNPAPATQMPKSSNTNLRKKKRLEKTLNNEKITEQQPTSFANLITGLGNTFDPTTRKLSTQEKSTESVKPVETFVIEHSSNSNSDLICIPSNNTYSSNFTSATDVPPVVIDLQDTNSSMNSLVSKDVTNASSSFYRTKSSSKKSKKDKKRKDRNVMPRQNQPLQDCDDQNTTTASTYHHKKPSDVLLLDEKSHSACPTISNISEILSLSNSSMSSVFPSADVVSKNIFQPGQSELASSSVTKMSKSDLTFAGKFKQNTCATAGGSNVSNYNSLDGMAGNSLVSNSPNQSKFSLFGGLGMGTTNSNDSSSNSRTSQFNAVVDAIRPEASNSKHNIEDVLVKHDINEKSMSNTSIKGNFSAENAFAGITSNITAIHQQPTDLTITVDFSSQQITKQPKKRGRKKGSKGVDSVIAKETSLSSQMLISSLSGVAGKKVKTTKELYAEMENRKLRNFKTVGLEEITGNSSTKWNTHQEQKAATFRRSPFYSDIAESDSCTMTSEPSRDSGNNLSKPFSNHGPLDNNSNYSKHNIELNIREERSCPSLSYQNSTLAITTKIKQEIQEILKLLTPPPSIKEIEYESFNSMTPCTCTIEEVTLSADTNKGNADGSANAESNLDATNSTNNNQIEISSNHLKTDQISSMIDKVKAPVKDHTDLLLSQQMLPAKIKKSIFDLDFDEDEDPLNSIIADIVGKNSKAEIEVKTMPPVAKNDGKPDVALNVEDDLSNIDHHPSSPYALNVPTASATDVISFPSYKVKFDPDCNAKNRFELQTQKITKFHINTLHNCFIPNVNGNWNHADVADGKPGNIKVLLNDNDVDKRYSKDFVIDGYDVVPLYGSDISEQIIKDLSHVKFTKRNKTNKHTKFENEIFFQIPFLGISRLLDFAVANNNNKIYSKNLQKLKQDEEKENVDNNLDLTFDISALDSTKNACFKRSKKHATLLKRSTIKRLKLATNASAESIIIEACGDEINDNVNISTEQLSQNAKHSTLNDTDSDYVKKEHNAENCSYVSEVNQNTSGHELSSEDNNYKYRHTALNQDIFDSTIADNQNHHIVLTIKKTLSPKANSILNSFSTLTSVLSTNSMANNKANKENNIECDKKGTRQACTKISPLRLKRFMKKRVKRKKRHSLTNQRKCKFKLHNTLFYHEEICPVVQNGSQFQKECIFQISSCSSGCSADDDEDDGKASKEYLFKNRTISIPSPSSSSSSSDNKFESRMLDLPQDFVQSEFLKRTSETCVNNEKYEGDFVLSDSTAIKSNNERFEDDENIISNNVSEDEVDLPEENNRMLLSFNNIYNNENNMLKQQNCDDYNNLNNNFNLIKYIDNKASSVNNINIINNNNSTCSNNYSDANTIITSSSGCSHDQNSTISTVIRHDNLNNDNNIQIKPFKEYQTGIRAVDEDVNDDDGNNCGRLQQFKEWHEVLQLRSYNDELLTVLPYVVLE